MSTALYRKYRPQTFDDVVGQEAIVRTLTNAIERDRIRQAYLFAGPRGTGKTSLARILAKSLNCDAGPTAMPCGTCASCASIAAGSSLDVIEMDAASQRGIDDVRELRDRAVLQPIARNKVYILDEAHQLTKDAFNALLKLIEEPPPHLVFVFCTTELDRMLGTVRSRCQTFLFARPRLNDLARLLRRIADAEQIEAPDAALAQVARAARGSFRDAVSTLDQLAAATGGSVTVPAALQLLGAVEEESLFQLVDLVADGDAAGALTAVERLVDRGQDLGRLVVDLLEHLRHLLVLQHMDGVPDSLPVTAEAAERLRRQADALPPGHVLRLIDLLAHAVEEQREGGDPRLPLELALVKVARPQHEHSIEAVLQRLERLEREGATSAPPRAGAPAAPTARPSGTDPPTRAATPHDPPAAAASEPSSGPAAAASDLAPVAEPRGGAPAATLDVGDLRAVWETAVIPALSQRSVPSATVFGSARPLRLEGDVLVLEFPPDAAFNRKLADEQSHRTVLAHVLTEVTGERVHLEFALAKGVAPEGHVPVEPVPGPATERGPATEPASEPAVETSAAPAPSSEQELISLLESDFDAQELREEERT